MRIAALVSLLFVIAGSVPAQVRENEPPPAATFSESVEVRVINVDVVVVDRAGRSVAGLGPDDFELRVDGEPVEISNFYAETAAGVATPGVVEAKAPGRADGSPAALAPTRRTHVVILVDHTRLRTANRKRAFAALREAIGRLGDDDLVSVVGIEGGLVFYTDFLFDRAAVGRVLDQVAKVSRQSEMNEFERRQIFGELARGQSGGLLGRTSAADEQMIISRIRGYAAEEYDRGVRSLQNIETVVSSMSGIGGRRLLFYVGEGVPTRPGEGLFVEWRNRFGEDIPAAPIGLRRTAVNTDYERSVGRYDLTPQMESLALAANRAGVTLYSVDAEASHGAEVRSALTEQGATSETLSVVDENFRAPLEFVSEATGGRLLRSSGLLADQVSAAISDSRTFYSLGFEAPEDWQAGTDHDVRVEVSGKRLRVRHRQQVWLHQPDELEAGATIAALLYQTLDNPLEARAVAGEPRVRDDGETALLPIDLEIPARRIGFVPGDGGQGASLSIYVTTKDRAGNAGRVQKLPFHLAIPDEFFEQALSDSARHTLPVVLRQGDQQVAIGIRDHATGLFSALRIEVAPLSRF